MTKSRADMMLTFNVDLMRELENPGIPVEVKFFKMGVAIRYWNEFATAAMEASPDNDDASA